MTARFAWTVGALMCVSATGGAQVNATIGVDPAAIDQLARAQVDSGFSGVVLVALGDSIVLHRAYGPRDKGITTRSTFFIASITKSFTAAEILILQTRGRLTVRDSLARFFPDAPADKRGITIHELLTHSAGFGGKATGANLTDRKAAVRRILSAPLIYAPGHGYQYGNEDYELLAAIIEVTTGDSWEIALRRDILDPLGLRHTAFWCGPWSRISRPVRGTGRAAERCGAGQVSDWGHRGANGMVSTSADLFTWMRVLRRGVGPNGVDFSPIETPQVEVRREDPFDVAYGYGARTYSQGNITEEVLHAGSGDEGHNAIARSQRAGLTLIVLSNAGFHGRGTWSSYLSSVIAPRNP